MAKAISQKCSGVIQSWKGMVCQKKDVVLRSKDISRQGEAITLSFSVIDDAQRQIRGMHF